MKIYYAKAVYNNKEISAVMNALKNPAALMNGPAVKDFEKKATTIITPLDPGIAMLVNFA